MTKHELEEIIQELLDLKYLDRVLKFIIVPDADPTKKY